MKSKFALLAFSAMALSLSACGSDKSGAPVSGEPLAKVAAPDGKSWTEVISKTEQGGYKMGNPDAKLQLVEYGAITCPGCAQFHVQSKTELEEMVATGVVAFEFRPFLVHGIQDVPGFLLAKCNGPEAFFGISDQMYNRQAEWLGKMQTLSEADRAKAGTLQPNDLIKFLAEKMDLVNFVKPLGVSEDAANQCLSDQKTFEALVKESETAQKDQKVSGTPAFFLNGADLQVGNWAGVKAALKNAGAS
ncbi:thioredoxin domain-containing protein [Sphingorhabdus arenilitoris]|uniref:Thioredoxin domain-containing protein n=1 Tax=Sphingorhabdus arenilitoris TaxID=1490041 RepID=A0ABV8RDD7_9SPHN